jgi:hypothetical protein
MANEIEILITAVDNATKTLDDIKDTVESSSKAIAVQNKETTKSFEDQMKGLIALGNTAATVDRIFSAYENLQLRLENATERVANAQDRLSDAQKKLTRLQKDNTASAEDLADAQQEVERATRGLTISQNNLQKTQNQAVGTYINMAVQTMTLIANLSSLTKTVMGAKMAEEAYNAVKAVGLALSGPYGWAILAGAAAVGVFAVSAMNSANAQSDFNSSVEASNLSTLKSDLNVVKQGYDDITISINNAIIQQDKFWKTHGTYVGGFQSAGTISANQGTITRVGGVTGGESVSFGGSTSSNSTGAFVADPNGRDRKNGVRGTWPTTPKKNDFVMRPGQAAVSFSPDDTLIGTKGGIGTTIIISGDNYGIDATQISNEIMKQLRRKIAI